MYGLRTAFVSLTGLLTAGHKKRDQNAKNGGEQESFDVVQYTQENDSYEEASYAKMNRNCETKGQPPEASYRVRGGTDERKAEGCCQSRKTLPRRLRQR